MQLELPFPARGPRPDAAAFVAERIPTEPPPIDGGPASCRRLDDAAFDQWVVRASATERLKVWARPRRVGLLGADWVATSMSLLCVAPKAGFIWRWPWAEVGLAAVDAGDVEAIVTVTLGSDSFDIRMGRSSAANVLAIAAYHRDGPGGQA